MVVPKRLILFAVASFLLSALPATSAPATKLVYNPINPCRLLDTRVAAQPLTGILTVGVPRTFFVAASDYTSQGGNPAGCGLPGFVDDGSGNLSTVVKAIAVNLGASGGASNGNIAGWAVDSSPVLASLINYRNFGPPPAFLNLANMVILPVCNGTGTVGSPPCSTGDVTFQANVSDVHLFADVLGFFTEQPLELPTDCADGDLATWDATNGVWACGTPVAAGDITAVAAGTGLTGGGTSGDVSLAIDAPYQLPQTCTAGQVAVWDSTGGVWVCGGNTGGNGFGFSKADVYENTGPTTPDGAGAPVTVTATCNDCNDIPLDGACRAVHAGLGNPPGVEILSWENVNWNNAAAPAELRCTFGNISGTAKNAQARILCVNVPGSGC